ncbi:hypothetical protein CCR94_05085 [Rhodoblastus sphagnicola]|uniref:Tc1-like transposase DDE domain-containing protein n=1 Tax=Rhodoblastus sphagnicola TaxID=333368 RepID=A0A2S6ND69_9HYPH|nr:hypothetical protein CCR94_05085 [Rhodoblastus sphagnicola]
MIHSDFVFRSRGIPLPPQGSPSDFVSANREAIQRKPYYTPELQPAETLWALVDEPLVNKHIATIDELDDIIGKRAPAGSIRPRDRSAITAR